MGAYSDYQNWTAAEKVGLLTKSINLAIEKERNRYLMEYGLTAVQTDVLQFITAAQNHGVEINQVDIEKEFHLSNPTVTGILKRLEAKDFIEKKESKKDRRYKWICLTDKAVSVFRRSWNNKRRIEEYLLRDIPQEQIDLAIAAMEKMMENMHALNAQTFDD